jgi:hypothetical protein
MDDHFCPICGVQHGAVGAEDSGDDDAVALAAVEGLVEVTTAALDAVVDVTEAQEETEQVEAVTEMVSDVAEEESEAEMVGDLTEEHSDDPEPELLEEPDDTEEESPSELEDDPLEVDEVPSEESTSVGVPPQLADDDAPRKSHSNTTNSFRRRRMKR